MGNLIKDAFRQHSHTEFFPTFTYESVLFGFSCLISYYVYAERAAVYIFGERCRPVVKLLWIVFILVGSVTTLGFAWDLADTFNGLMIIPNLIGIVLLSGQVVSAWNEYRDRL